MTPTPNRVASGRPKSRFSRIAACRLLPIVYGLSFTPLHAEVFWRRPFRADSVLEDLQGTPVYATDVTLNGHPGTLTAFAFSRPASEVSRDLCRRLGLSSGPSSGGALVTGTVKDRLYRLLVLPPKTADGTCLVLAFGQSLRDADRSAGTAPAWPEGVPALNAPPLFAAVCAKTRTAFVTAESHGSPEAALAQAAQTLLAAGWTEALPTTDGTFRLFISGGKQCALFAASHPQTGRTTISLLQREGATP